MKKLLTVSALTLALAAPAFAGNSTTTDTTDAAKPAATETAASQEQATGDKFLVGHTPNDLMASRMIGARVYAVEKSFDPQDQEAIAKIKEEGTDWNDIGEVNDVVLSMKGDVKAVILGVGGFLGIGEKDVAIPMKRLSLVSEEGTEADEFFIVVNSTKAELEKAPTFKRNVTN